MKTDAVVIVLVAALLSAAASPAFSAEEGVVKRTHPVVVKLGRGLANTFGGVLEVPITIQQVALERGPVAGATLGTLVGAGRAFARTATGIFETLTFLFPLSNGYEPIFLPEFVLEPAAAASTPLAR